MPIPAGGLVYAGRDEPTNGVEVAAAFGADLAADPGTWSWTDLSSRLLADPIRLRAGRSSGADRPSPGTCSVTLANDDGALTPLNAGSVYWPNVELGTPLRVSLRRVEDSFGRTSAVGWGTTDSGHVWSMFGAGGTLSTADFPVSGGKGQQSVPAANAYRSAYLFGLSVRDCRVRLSGVSLPFSDVTGGSVEPANILLRARSNSSYYMARLEITTAEAVVCRLFNPAGSELASATVSGLTHSAAQTLEVVAEVVGSTLRMKVWATSAAEPAGWAVTATDTTLTLPGGIGVRTGVAAGNTNTKPVVASYDSVTVFVDRFSGFADQWEPTYVPTGVVGDMSSAVQITASGVLRRLQQGDPPDESPLQRTISASNPVGYWPAEDGVTAGQAGAATAGGPPLVVTGSVEFKPLEDFNYGTSTSRYGTSALGDLANGGSLSAVLPAGSAAATKTAWTVHVIGDFDIAFSSGDIVLMEWTTPGGTFVRWRLLEIPSTARTQVIAYTAEGAATVVVDRDGAIGGFRPWIVSAKQSGGNIQVTYWLDSTTPITGTVAGTLAGVTSMTVNPTRTTSSIPMPFGHLAVWGTQQAPYPTDPAVLDSYGAVVYQATRSYLGETAIDRMRRLCAEDGIALDVADVPAESLTRMGWQDPGQFEDLLQECVDADGGLLFERGFGLGYTPRHYRYDPPVAMTVDLATYEVTGSGDVLTPTYDDQEIRNRWTVNRRDGSFAVADDPASQRRGIYPDSVELNVASDDGLLDQASWRVHLTTVVELREDTFPIDLAANPDLVDAWLSCGVGSRIVRTNPPAQYGPGPLDRLVEGWSETIGPSSWMVQVNPSPAGVWDTATVDGAQITSADGTTLTSGISASATSFQVTSTTASGAWSTDPADYPQDLLIGGERVTATGVTGTGLTQTVALSVRGLNGFTRAWPAGTQVDVWQPAITAL